MTATGMGAGIDARGVSKSFGEREVLVDLDLTVKAGEFVAIVGRSGCGKSTFLRLVAGLDALSGGQITVDGGAPHIGGEDSRMMFQDARLLPWKRVLQNVALGLPKSRAHEAADALEEVGLAGREQDWPSVLSGGQRQRVALAGALVHRPRLLLLDEPLGALDALTRLEMQRLIERLWESHGFTAVLVTHDVEEAVAMADRVIVVEAGQIALDVPVDLPRPRNRGSQAFSAVESAVLARVMKGMNLASTIPRELPAAAPPLARTG